MKLSKSLIVPYYVDCTCRACPCIRNGYRLFTVTISATNSGGINTMTCPAMFWNTKYLPFIKRPLKLCSSNTVYTTDDMN